MGKTSAMIDKVLAEYEQAINDYIDSYDYEGTMADIALANRDKAESNLKQLLADFVTKAIEGGILARDIVQESELRDAMWRFSSSIRMLKEPSHKRHKIQLEREYIYWGSFLRDYANNLLEFCKNPQ